MKWLPEGVIFTRAGVTALMSAKSSAVTCTLASLAMARVCISVLVEPHIIMSTRMAFSKASRVMMSRGRMFFS